MHTQKEYYEPSYYDQENVNEMEKNKSKMIETEREAGRRISKYYICIRT